MPSYPTINDREFNLLKKIAENTAEISAGGGGGGGGAVSSVNGQTGIVVIGQADIGLSNVNNTSDSNKPVSTAQAAAIATAQSTAISTAASDATTKANAAQAAAIAASQPLDADLTAISGLATTVFGRSLLTQADAVAARATIGAGTSSFDGVFASLSAKPTTLSGYGITDAQPLDSDLTAIAALATTTYGRSLLTQADALAARTTLDADKALSIQSISSNKTIAAADNEALIRCTATLTIQLDGVATSTRIYVTSVGDNTITFTAGSGMTISGSTTIVGNGATATLVQVSSTVWEVYSVSASNSLHTSLFAFYPLDETASTTTRRDIFGGETVTATAGTASAAGKTRLRAVLMAAAANQAYLTTTGAGDFKFNRGAGALTVSGWVKATALTNAATLASLYTTTGNKRVWFFDVSTAGKARFAINTDGTSGGTLIATSTATLVTGTWYFLVGYYNPTTGKIGIIVNAGTPDETTASAGMFVTTGIAMNIGAQESSATVSAALQDIGFWSRNLSTSEVARLYNSGNGLTYPFLP